jgi:hypothetical protein
MKDESSHNNPQDVAEERFTRIEEKVVHISHNMALLLETIENKFGAFGEVGGSNS